MTPIAELAILLALSAIVLATIAGWTTVALATRIARCAAPDDPVARASLIAQLRLLPLTFAALLSVTQVLAFARYEAGGTESAGPLLLCLGAAGAALVLDALRTGVRSWFATREVLSAWQSGATPLNLPTWSRRAWTINRRFPIVAVVGIIRPQLFVASRVATNCSGEELAAIAAHEAAHVAARDNLIRLLFEFTPGARLFRRIAEPLERAWMVASEQAADAMARQSASQLDLASALTKVARMAVAVDAQPVSGSALIGGADLASRVRRLCEDAPVPRRRRLLSIPAMMGIAVLVAIVTTPALRGLHNLFELLVQK